MAFLFAIRGVGGYSVKLQTNAEHSNGVERKKTFCESFEVHEIRSDFIENNAMKWILFW